MVENWLDFSDCVLLAFSRFKSKILTSKKSITLTMVTERIVIWCFICNPNTYNTMIFLAVMIPCLTIAVTFLIRMAVVMKEIQRGGKQGPGTATAKRTKPISTVVVLGSGGHTTEMLQLLQYLAPQHYTPLTFIVARTDTTSLPRVTAMGVRSADAIHFIPRSREVGQSYASSILTTLWSLVYSLGLVLWIRPGLLLCNGPGTCLPIAVWTFLGRILGLWEGKIIFCESFCRVKTLSLTGKLLYPIVDLFVVHWEQLQAKFPRSHLVTTFVPRQASNTGSNTSSGS